MTLSMNPSVKTRFMVPPNPEMMAAGFGCLRSIKMAPSPVDSAAVESETALASFETFLKKKKKKAEAEARHKTRRERVF